MKGCGAKTLVGTVVIATLLLLLSTAQAAPPIPVPEVKDPQLRVELFAAEPDIVTPVGLAVDGKGRLYAIESHTHSPRPDYKGPKHDLIKVFEDRNRDGRADKVSVFAEGWQDAMNLAFAPDGSLYVVYQAGVDRLVDADGDGRAEDRRTVLELDTKQKYDHSGLLGITFSADGWLYVSRGNVGGFAHAFVGSDGRRLEGYGDGGNIVRCRPDGTSLELVATGFWNPFDLRFDGAGRLLAVDNDPDSRGPNRLLHIVPGGDYGYKTRYGGNGLHPFSGWNAELPGTLPFLAGVGESPSGLLDADTAALPPGYKGNVLVTIWAENSIERFRPEPAGVSLQAKREVLVRGTRDFRPVGIVAAPDGTVYISDWVKKDYPNHGLGRLWRLTAKPGVARATPRAATPVPDAGTRRLQTLAGLSRETDLPALRAALEDEDPFVRAVAVGALSRPPLTRVLTKELRHRSAKVRLGALLALRRAGGSALPIPAAPSGALPRLLNDPDQTVRMAALMWTAETMDLSQVGRIRQAVARPGVSSQLLQIYLATKQLLTRQEVAHLKSRTPRSSAGERIQPEVVEPVLRDRTLSPDVLAMALPLLGEPKTAAQRALVEGFLGSSHLGLRTEAVRALATAQDDAATQRLLGLARDTRLPSAIRTEALAGLAGRTPVMPNITALLDDADPAVQRATARLLRAAAQQEPVKAALTRRLAKLKSDARTDPSDPALAAALLLAVDPAQVLGDANRPSTPEAWQKAVGTGGDPAAGRLVFVHPMVSCNRCHAVNARGGHIGPDLSHIASSVDRTRLLDSILNPGEEVSPEFQAYTVKMKNGQEHIGSQFHFRSGGTRVSLRLLDGSDIVLDLNDVAAYEASNTSFMPQGLEAAMTVEELRDLLAYLSTLK